MNEWDNWTLEQKTPSLDIAVNFLTTASLNGNLQEVKDLHALIVQKFDTTVDTQDVRRLQHTPLEWAAEKGHYEVVDYLIPLSVFDHRNTALNKAAQNGHTVCVHALIPHYSPEALSDAMADAVYKNQWDAADMLLAFDPPNIHNEYELCLIWSSAHNNLAFLKRFYALCNPERALQMMRESEERGHGWSDEETELLRQYHSPQAQRERLAQQVGKGKGTSRRAKI